MGARALVLTLGLVGMMGLPMVAAAQQPLPEDGMQVLLPMPGTDLVVEVSVDDLGSLEVALDPAGELTEDGGRRDHKVRFASLDGTTSLVVAARGGKLRTTVKTDALEGILGEGSWSADLPGVGPATVSYLVGATPDGYPDVSIIGVAEPTSATGTVIHPSESEVEDDEAASSARVDFLAGEQRWTVKISAKLSLVEEGRATLKVTMQGRGPRPDPPGLDDVAGPHTWTGELCDGTAVTVAYLISSDGKLSEVTVDGGPAVVVETPHGVDVLFEGTDRRVRLELKTRGDGVRIVVGQKGDKCGHDEADENRGNHAGRNGSETDAEGESTPERSDDALDTADVDGG